MSSWTDYQVTQFFAALPASPYLGLHYANPSLGGLGMAEFSGGSYARQVLTLSAVNSRAVYNTNAILFTGLLASTVAFLGVWDAASAGNLRAYIGVLPTVPVVGGGQFPVNVGDLALVF
jgi:hypothetical protein